jgi:hypothetical protein
MNHHEYKKAKEKLGMNNPDIWCGHLNIAKDTDKSYSSGRLSIPKSLELKVNKFVEIKEEKVRKLKSIISDIFPNCSVQQCEITNDIDLYIKEFDVKVKFKNDGKDHFSHDVYSFIGRGKINHLILYYPENPWEKKPEKTNFNWYYWRAEAVNVVGVKYHHKITLERLQPLMLPKKQSQNSQ